MLFAAVEVLSALLLSQPLFSQYPRCQHIQIPTSPLLKLVWFSCSPAPGSALTYSSPEPVPLSMGSEKLKEQQMPALVHATLPSCSAELTWTLHGIKKWKSPTAAAKQITTLIPSGLHCGGTWSSILKENFSLSAFIVYINIKGRYWNKASTRASLWGKLLSQPRLSSSALSSSLSWCFLLIGCSELASHFSETCHVVPLLSWKSQYRSLDSADNFLAVGKKLETIVEFMDQEWQSL